MEVMAEKKVALSSSRSSSDLRRPATHKPARPQLQRTTNSQRILKPRQMFGQPFNPMEVIEDDTADDSILEDNDKDPDWVPEKKIRKKIKKK